MNSKPHSYPEAHFSQVPRTFRARKAIHKTTTCLFCKAGLFICCKGNKNKNNCKVSCLKMHSFWRYKENYVTRKTPKKFRDFRETGPRSSLQAKMHEKKNVTFTKILPLKVECHDKWLPRGTQSVQHGMRQWCIKSIELKRNLLTHFEKTFCSTLQPECGRCWSRDYSFQTVRTTVNILVGKQYLSKSYLDWKSYCFLALKILARRIYFNLW